MGLQASKPRSGVKLQVIGAGLPRTGTASFTEALALLLDGPVYHSGTQLLVSGDEFHIKTQMEILSKTPIKREEDKALVLEKLKALTNGYVATADSAMCQFVPELMELYPDAVVICTVRDPDAWAKSMGTLANASLQNLLALMLFWVPCLRYFPRWVRLLHAGRWGELYSRPGEGMALGRITWDRHIEYLERSVQRNRLFYYSVKDGWEPLCKILDMPVPKGVEFPRINDSEAMDQFAKKQVNKGLRRWALAAIVTAGLVASGLRVTKSAIGK